MILTFLGFLHLAWTDILDIFFVAVIIFFAFRWIKGSSAMNIFIAIIILLLIWFISSALDMKMISTLLGTVLDVGTIAIIIIFQPEIRRFLNKIGRSAGSTIGKRSFLRKFWPTRTAANLSADSVSEMVRACEAMSLQKCGALILIRKGDMLEDIIATGDTVDAHICSRLLQNIFFKNSPLHDGAMVIGDDRIIAARCTLPITDRQDLPAQFGMRHKAAVGISEVSDCDVVVVSEETGGISFVHGGEVTHISNINTLRLLLGGANTEEASK